MRHSVDNLGVLLELRWTGVLTKAARVRLMFWWSLGRTEAALMRRLEWEVHIRQVVSRTLPVVDSEHHVRCWRWHGRACCR